METVKLKDVAEILIGIKKRGRIENRITMYATMRLLLKKGTALQNRKPFKALLGSTNELFRKGFSYFFGDDYADYFSIGGGIYMLADDNNFRCSSVDFGEMMFYHLYK